MAIDFKKLNDKRRAKLSPEERALEDKYKKLKEENVFYQTGVVAENRDMHVHYGDPIKEEKLPVKVYRQVHYYRGKEIVFHIPYGISV